VAIVIGLTIAVRSSIEALSSGRTARSTAAFYGAETGIEDALAKLNRDAAFSSAGYEIEVGESTVTIMVDTVSSPKTITATSTQRGITRKLRVDFAITNDAANNDYGVITLSNWREVTS